MIDSTAVIVLINLLLSVNSIKPVLRNSYPDSGNYSVVTLSCYENGFTLAKDAVFRWNDTSDVKDVMQESNVIDGEMTIVLTQQKEGTFHCESNGNSSNAMYLAGIIFVTHSVICDKCILTLALGC